MRLSEKWFDDNKAELDILLENMADDIGSTLDTGSGNDVMFSLGIWREAIAGKLDKDPYYNKAEMLKELAK